MDAQSSTTKTKFSQAAVRHNKGGKYPRGILLNLEEFDPRSWPQVINRWERDVVRAWHNHPYSTLENGDAHVMFEFLETFLGEVVGNMYDTYKRDFSDEVKEIKGYGNNPYNFTSMIREKICGVDANRGNIELQNFASRELEQLRMDSWDYLGKYCNEFFSIASRTGNAFDEEIGDRFFRKLPGVLGRQIENEWKNSNFSRGLGVGRRIMWTHEQVRKKLVEIEIEKDAEEALPWIFKT